MHRNNKKGHVFDINASYIKSGADVLFETKKLQLIKQAYHKKLCKSLQLYLKNGKTEKCLQKIKKELSELDPKKIGTVVGLQIAGIGAIEILKGAGAQAGEAGIKAIVGAASHELPGLSYACLLAIEIGYAGRQLYKGKITSKQFWLTTGKSAIKCTAGAGGSIGGFALGAMIGTTMGPIGTIVGGIIGAAVGGFLSYTGAKVATNAFLDWDWLKKKYPWLEDSEKVK